MHYSYRGEGEERSPPCELCFLPDRPDLKSLTPCRNADTAGLQQNVTETETETTV